MLSNKMRYTKQNILMKDKQTMALNLLNKGENLFLTGPGGVGKTAVLKAFASQTTKKLAITSTTGTSALLLNGTTVHSFLGIGLGKEKVSILVDRIIKSAYLKNRWCQLECLIIDEISMMHPDLFDKIEQLARTIRKSDVPFGGIQLVLSGDFLQLPCIGTMNFCFEAKSWNKCVTNVVCLDEIIRQGDKKFQKCLNAVRMGEITREVRDILESRVGAKLHNTYGIRPTKLYAKNINVDKENDLELDKLAEQGKDFLVYEMNMEVQAGIRTRKNYLLRKFYKYCPVSERVELCVGAQVMLMKNIDMSCGLANGSRGVVMGFNDSSMPIIRFLNGEQRAIGMEIWDMKEKNKRVIRAYQIPLRVAYAISIHKSQGCSLDYAEVDLSNIFEYGQAYVALSRVKSLNGLSIKAIDYKCIQADPIAVSYYQSLR